MSEGLLLTWPKSERTCNLGDCPAFKLTKYGLEYLEAARHLAKTESLTMDEIVAKIGPPIGMCLVNEKKVVVNSECSVSDTAFVEYFRNQAQR